MKELEEDNRERRVRITDKSLPGKRIVSIKMNYQVSLFVGVKRLDITVIFN